MSDIELELMTMVDTMIGCAVDLNQHSWENLVKTREIFKETIHNKLYKISD